MSKRIDHTSIEIKGACEHNLQKIDVTIPRNSLVVITGVSGSGKSSLAFDTVFAEGQRKYMESLSAYARQFLDQMKKPKVEKIEGLPPTIAIAQRSAAHNPRSTVATTTEIYDYLRLLYARCGSPKCWHKNSKDKICGKTIEATTSSSITNAILQIPSKTKVMLAAPIIRGKKGFHKESIESLRKAGLVRIRVNGNIMDIRDALKSGGENPLGIGRYEMHNIEAIVDRIVIDQNIRQRVAESVETCLKVGNGSILVLEQKNNTNWSEKRYSEKFACPDHPECTIEEMEPRLFSFNSPYGACSECAGLGTTTAFDPDRVIPHTSQPLSHGAIVPWRRNGPRMNRYYARLLRKLCREANIDGQTPFENLSKSMQQIVLYGTTEKDESKLGFEFRGVLPELEHRMMSTESDQVRERLQSYTIQANCPTCNGDRLRNEALNVTTTSGKRSENIATVARMKISEAKKFITKIKLDKERSVIAAPILRELNSRLEFLENVGLEYLSLSRRSTTLSGGEAQRIRLATQVGSGLVGVCYVLDEPTIGLHPKDNKRLIKTLRELADIGNTVLVVEHDEEMIRAADHLIDIGLGAGQYGGKVIAQGTVKQVLKNKDSLTSKYLSGTLAINSPQKRRPVNITNSITVKGAKENNLKNIDVSFPLEGIVCVTGVSGSGKSTLVNSILVKAAHQKLGKSGAKPGIHQRVNGLHHIDRVIEVNQTPIGRTPRSNPATYTSIFDNIRSLFSESKESKIRGYKPGRFSFNVKGGRCESCQGQGVQKIEMHFLPDVFVTCDTCLGTRYNSETLEVKWKGLSIADILSLSISEANIFFKSQPRIGTMLQCLEDVGLGYITLGQPSTQLSGGEAQRIKLAKELGTKTSGKILYVLDEPTTGLHFSDIDKLLHVLQKLADRKNTLIIIEHNLDVIQAADWVIDLGPEGGDAGGEVVAQGPPEKIALSNTYTGQFINNLINKNMYNKKTAEKPRKER